MLCCRPHMKDDQPQVRLQPQCFVALHFGSIVILVELSSYLSCNAKCRSVARTWSLCATRSLRCAGPAGPSCTYVPARGRRSKGVQAVAVREQPSVAQQSRVDVDNSRSLSGLDWTQDRPEPWSMSGQLHCDASCSVLAWASILTQCMKCR